MGLQDYAWLGAAVVAAITIYNLISSFGQRRGETDAQHIHRVGIEKAWDVRFSALEASVVLHHTQVNERFEKLLERQHDALLTMAREHATKADLHAVEQRVVDRLSEKIDIAMNYTPPAPRKVAAKT
jgi:hypothetical protein